LSLPAFRAQLADFAASLGATAMLSRHRPVSDNADVAKIAQASPVSPAWPIVEHVEVLGVALDADVQVFM
jgi:hypothetical protein